VIEHSLPRFVQVKTLSGGQRAFIGLSRVTIENLAVQFRMRRLVVIMKKRVARTEMVVARQRSMPCSTNGASRATASPSNER
jgi:hypothetical protein